MFETRTTTSGIRYAKAKVNEVNGVILLPDDWETSYYTLSNTNTGNANYSSNTISETEWATLERHGAIFLPAAGYRFGTSVSGVNSFGLYWSASYDDSNYAWSLYYGGSFLNTESNSDRSFAFPVRLVLPLQEGPYGISVVANPSVGGTLSGARAYDFGTSCTLTATPAEGYTFVNWTEVVDDTGTPNVVSTNAEYTFRVTGSRVLVANFELAPTSPEGTINGKFSVNADGDQVYFSKGNLQYIGSAATPYWKFADHQWDYLGDNGQGSDSQTVDRDLFGWGTSGYDHGANCYQPWSTSTTNRDYYAYGSGSYNLNDQTGKADWGYNAISNGGNTENQWFTLSHDEWDYVFNTRTTTSGIRYAKAEVNNVNGVILLPDDWDASFYTLSNTNTDNARYDSNIISETEWATLEQHGAVFLPAAGNRLGTAINRVGNYGYYWTASRDSGGYSDIYSWNLNFYTSYISWSDGYYRVYGFSVRLVRSLH